MIPPRNLFGPTGDKQRNQINKHLDTNMAPQFKHLIIRCLLLDYSDRIHENKKCNNKSKLSLLNVKNILKINSKAYGNDKDIRNTVLFLVRLYRLSCGLPSFELIPQVIPFTLPFYGFNYINPLETNNFLLLLFLLLF